MRSVNKASVAGEISRAAAPHPEPAKGEGIPR